MTKGTLANPPDTSEGVVYVLSFPNGAKYVGLTERTFAQRAAEHVKKARGAGSNDLPVTRAIRKYGPANISVEIVVTKDSVSDLGAAESFRIEIGRLSGERLYNVAEGGFGSLGWFRNAPLDVQERVRLRSRSVLLSLWSDPKFRTRMTALNRARLTSQEHREYARARMCEMNSDPLFKEASKKRLAAIKDTESYRTSFLESVQRRMADPQWVKDQGRRLRKYYDDPENRAKAAEALAARNADPVFQEKRLAAVRKAIATPEWAAANAAKNAALAKIKPEQYRELADLRKYGFSIREIAQLYSAAQQTIRNALHKM